MRMIPHQMLDESVHTADIPLCGITQKNIDMVQIFDRLTSMYRPIVPLGLFSDARTAIFLYEIQIETVKWYRYHFTIIRK
jgi:hypothetical protein